MSFLIKVWKDGLGGQACVRGQVCVWSDAADKRAWCVRTVFVLCMYCMLWCTSSLWTFRSLEVIRMSREPKHWVTDVLHCVWKCPSVFTFLMIDRNLHRTCSISRSLKWHFLIDYFYPKLSSPLLNLTSEYIIMINYFSTSSFHFYQIVVYSCNR